MENIIFQQLLRRHNIIKRYKCNHLEIYFLMKSSKKKYNFEPENCHSRGGGGAFQNGEIGLYTKRKFNLIN